MTWRRYLCFLEHFYFKSEHLLVNGMEFKVSEIIFGTKTNLTSTRGYQIFFINIKIDSVEIVTFSLFPFLFINISNFQRVKLVGQKSYQTQYFHKN